MGGQTGSWILSSEQPDRLTFHGDRIDLGAFRLLCGFYAGIAGLCTLRGDCSFSYVELLPIKHILLYDFMPPRLVKLGM